jgi:GR25 family glycosyltransferase involved in LPS biosynthesis
MMKQLERVGATGRYERFEAVDGKEILLNRATACSPGEVGIYKSHMDILERALGKGKAVHVMEDDIVLCDLTVPVIDTALHRGIFDHHDIVFTEMFIDRTLHNLNSLSLLYSEITERGTRRIEKPTQIKVMDVSETYLFGATSYVVGPHSLNRVLTVLHREWRRGPTMPIDRLFQEAARSGQLSLACFFPFVTTIDFDLAQFSAAERDETADRALAQRLLRYSFFAHRDIRGVALPLIRDAINRLDVPDREGEWDFHASIMKYFLGVARIPTPHQHLPRQLRMMNDPQDVERGSPSPPETKYFR